MPARKKTSITIAVVAVGILVLIGSLLTSLVQKKLDSQSQASPVDGTSKIETTSTTLQNPTVITTPSIISTDTPTSTEGPSFSEGTPTPVASLTPTGDSTIFEDTFIDNRNNWHTESTLVSVVAGTYTHVLNCPASSSASHCGNFIQIPFTFPSSFRMEIETTIRRSSDGAGVMVGFQVRRSDDGYYYINYGITDSSYQMSRVTQTGAFPIIPETQTDLIASAVGDTNIPGIQIEGAEFTPLLNGQEIAPIHDGNIRTAGDTYLVVLVERGHTAELQLDNLVVKAVD